VQIRALGLSALSGADGRFTFDGVPTVSPYLKFDVLVTAIGYGTWAERNVVLRPGGVELLVDLGLADQSATYVPIEEQAPVLTAAARTQAGQVPASVAPAAAAPRLTQSACSGYYSDTVAPSLIRVYRVNLGVVQLYDFRFYVAHVLPNEWIPSWNAEALRSGAIAVKEYGWYWVNHWRGGSAGGSCYDVDDSTNYQSFNPNVSSPTTSAAVSVTWAEIMQKGGAVLETSYRAGSAVCARTDGSSMSQNGSQQCASQGLDHRAILTTFYDLVTFMDIPIPATAITGSGTAYVFWKGIDGNLWQAQGSGNGYLGAGTSLGFGTLGSEPTAGVDAQGNTYVYWEGGNMDLFEAYWNGAQWVGPYNFGMGPLGSAPTVAITASGGAYVFWRGTDGNLYEAQGDARHDATHHLYGPYNRNMGVLGSAPAVGLDSSSNTYIYWEGGNQGLWEAYWDGAFEGPFNIGMGPIGSPPGVAVNGSGQAFVFWRGGNDPNLWEAQGNARYLSYGVLAGPYNRLSPPLYSGPTLGLNSQSYTYTYWEGQGLDLIELYYNGGFVGPVQAGPGPLT
jgi:hypothetical protein